MTGGIDVAGANALAHPKLRRGWRVSAGGHPLRNQQRHFISGKRRTRLLRAARRLSALDLPARDQAALDEQLRHPNQKPFVVAHAEILRWWNEFLLMTGKVDRPFPPGSHCPVQRKNSPFPACMEDRLVLLLLDWAHAVHAAHVMHSVHACSSFVLQSDFRNADHRIARDQRGKRLLVQTLITSRSLWQDQVTQLRRAVPNAHLDVL